MPTLKPCEFCGKEFVKRHVSPDAKHREKFCSQACHFASRPKRRTTLVCQSCAATFEVFNSQLGKCNVRFCSRDCWRAGIKVASVPCPRCGIQFVPNPRTQEHCSRACKVAHTKRPLLVRLWEKIDATGGTDACWPWTNSVNSGGYGQIQSNGRGSKRVTAHRVVFETIVGPIGAGLEIDHLCRNRRCCNPAHLEPVTAAENVRRGMAGDLRTECKNGHPRSVGMTTFPNGRRECKVCVRAREDRKLRGRKRQRHCERVASFAAHRRGAARSRP